MVEVDRTPGVRPRRGLGRSLDAAARRAVPGAMLLALLFGAGASVFPQDGTVRPAMAFGIVFAWTLLRPASMPPPLVFAAGMVGDLLDWLPPGVGTLALLAVQAAALRWRSRLLGRGWIAEWLGFSASAAAGFGIIWCASAALALAWLPAAPAVAGWLLASALFPALALLVRGLNGRVANPDRA